jgi:type IV pilus assembly protein PilY1
MNTKYLLMYVILAVGGMLPYEVAHATLPSSCTSSSVNENFTGLASTCTWNWVGGACMTAAPAGTVTSPGPLPQCVGSAYYGNQTQVGGNSGNLNTTPDTPVTGGALRLTNAANNQAGAIISTTPFALLSNGLQVSFTTETYAGDSGGQNHDGADGISFFLQDASVPVTLGDYGGSLGYTCSNQNGSSPQGYDGMVGGFLGLGIDEYGNFLNGTTITNFNAATGVTTYSQSTGADNTSSGYGYVPNRIGLRGPGSTAWSALSSSLATSQYYPLTLTGGPNSQQASAVRLACQTGYAWDFSAAATVADNTIVTNGFANPYNAVPVPAVTLSNYGAIVNGYTVLTAHNIATEGASILRGYATPGSIGPAFGAPITYNLTISTTGLLSLAYSYGGGNFLPVITGQQLPANLPPLVRFGFAGSTGGSTNVHEIMCFQALPQNSSQSSAGLNQKQTAKVQSGTQVYFAYYNANNWTGDLTSQYLDSPDGNPNDLQIDPVVNWSASCNLTGTLVPGQLCGKTNQPLVAPPNPDSGRVMLTYNGGGVPFHWSNLSAGQQASLDFGDLPVALGGPAVDSRTEYLRGSRADEQTPQGVDPLTPLVNPSGYRARTSVLGDIIDSSPTWVGPPSVSFPATWSDMLHSAVVMPENSGLNYAAFQSTYGTRLNVVYTGANDGFLHGFETGHFTAAINGTFNPANNDGAEVLAFMPGYVVKTINSSTLPNTLPVTPNFPNDYTNPLYAHKFNVDGTPGTGDLFYNGQWHTWLVGGLGAGGSSIYALDITDPSQFTEGHAGAIVIGEWTSSIQSTTTTVGTVTTTTVTGGTADFVCAGNPTCGNSLGKTFGTPQIRRFHNDPAVVGSPNTSWGAVFGNGSGSYNGDAGIYVMMVNTSGTTALAPPTFYYLSTGVGTRTGTPNGIYFVTPTDMDGDHVTDYVYAGDLQGNVWRFDLTNRDPSQWAVTKISGTPTPIFSTCSNNSSACTAQPITTAVLVASVAATPNPRILVEFGTGKQTQSTVNTATTYSGSPQYLMGIWDWNMGPWNALSPVQYLSLASGPTGPSCFSGTSLCGTGNLLAQSIAGTFDQNGVASTQTDTSPTGAFFRTFSSAAVCWANTAGCNGSGATAPMYGWSISLATGYANPNDANFPTLATTTNAPFVNEQVIFNPVLEDGAFIVNTTIPPTTSLAQCASTSAGGWTMAINPATGGAFTNSFFGDSNHNFLNIQGAAVSGEALNGTGSPSVVGAGTNVYVVTQTISGSGAIAQINPPGGTQGNRLTWIEKR